MSDASPEAARAASVRLLIGTAMISFSAVFVKLADLPPTAIGFYRVLIGGLMLVALVLWRRDPLFRGRALAMLVTGAVFFALDLAFWHRSIVYVGPGLATLLANFQVFVLALAGVLVFGEPLRWRLLASIPLAFAGLAILIGLDWSVLEPQVRRGVLLGLATAAVYSGYILSLRRARTLAPRLSSIGDLAVASLVTAVLLGGASLTNGESLAIPTVTDGVVLAAYGAVGQVFGWALISSALPYVPAARVGLMLLLQPTLSFVWDVLFFQRPMSLREGFGAGLALMAIYLGSQRD